MRHMRVFTLIALALFVLGCTDTNHVAGDAETFFEQTTIDIVLLEASFRDDESFALYDDIEMHRDVDPDVVTSREALRATLETHEHIATDLSGLDALAPCDDATCRYVIVPLFSYHIITEYAVWGSYEDGLLAIWLAAQPSNFPATDLRMVVMRLETAFTIDVIVNPTPYDAFDWRRIDAE